MDDATSETDRAETNGPSRREFLTRAGLVAGGIALLGVPAIRPQAAAEAAVDARVSAGGFYALELDGQLVDVLRSVEGGFPKGEVAQVSTGPTQSNKKQIVVAKYQDIAMQCDPVMPKLLFDWIAATLAMNPIRKSGAIITADFTRAEQSRLQFNNALITEIGFPACDVSSKEPGYLTVKCGPESTTPLPGKGSTITAFGAKQKSWVSSNFRLSIAGLDCSRVAKIEAFTFKQSLAPDSIGQGRIPQREPAKLEFPNLVLNIPEAYAGTFYAWFQAMVIKGDTGESNEKSGSLELLDPTLKNTLFTVNFHNLGIFGFSPEKAVSYADATRRVNVELYCEHMTIGTPRT